MGLVSPNPGTIFWLVIVFGIVMLILKKFAWKPILNALKERENSIASALLSADNARKEVASLKADHEAIRLEAQREKEQILKEAREIKEKMIGDAKTEAQLQGEKLIAQAKSAIEGEKNAALAELKNQVSSLSLDIAEKILKDELTNKDAQSKLVEKMLGEAKLN